MGMAEHDDLRFLIREGIQWTRKLCLAGNIRMISSVSVFPCTPLTGAKAESISKASWVLQSPACRIKSASLHASSKGLGSDFAFFGICVSAVTTIFISFSSCGRFGIILKDILTKGKQEGIPWRKAFLFFSGYLFCGSFRQELQSHPI